MALLQKSLKLITMAFYDYVLIHFGACSKVLTNQVKEF